MHRNRTANRILDANSILNRLEELRKLLVNIDIFIGVESWLHSEVPKTKLNFPGFLLLQKDRLYSTGGGIIFIIRNNLAYKMLNNLIIPNVYLKMLSSF